jgi:hypothetical protein
MLVCVCFVHDTSNAWGFVLCLSLPAWLAVLQVLKAAAASPESLLEAEQLLQQAIDIIAQLSKEEGGLLVESNKACAAEVEAADAARAALAMLLCQRGQDADAAAHLKALGYKFRLSQKVWHCGTTHPAGRLISQPLFIFGSKGTWLCLWPHPVSATMSPPPLPPCRCQHVCWHS